MSTEEIFKKSGAILEGHFLLNSGLHSPIYWEKFKVLQSPHYTEQLCRMIANHYQKEKIQVVAGPTTGGIILAYETAKQLGVRGIFAERTGDAERSFRRGFSIIPGERVLIIDDILTTGNSIHQVKEAVTKQDGDWWIGWIEEVPGVNCQERSREELLESLRASLTEALEFKRQDAIRAAESGYTEELVTV